MLQKEGVRDGCQSPIARVAERGRRRPRGQDPLTALAYSHVLANAGLCHSPDKNREKDYGNYN